MKNLIILHSPFSIFYAFFGKRFYILFFIINYGALFMIRKLFFKTSSIIIVMFLFFSSVLALNVSSNENCSDSEHIINNCLMFDGPMNSAWPTYGQNNQHTSQSPYNTLNNPMDIKWKFTTSFLGFESSPVIDKNGVLYLACKDGFCMQ